jgi:hypothetical protein
MGRLRAVLAAGHRYDHFDAAGNLLERRRAGFAGPILSVQVEL